MLVIKLHHLVTVHFNKKTYLINHVSTEVLSTGRMITSVINNSPPAEVSTLDENVALKFSCDDTFHQLSIWS